MNSCLQDQGTFGLFESHRLANGTTDCVECLTDPSDNSNTPSFVGHTFLTTTGAHYSLIPSRLFVEGKFAVCGSGFQSADASLVPSQTLPLPGWFHQQPENREILIRWMDRICSQMRFSGQTLSLAVFLMDLLSQTLEEPRLETRLIALVCLYLASKLHEPQNNYLKAEAIHDFFGGKFSKEDVYRCERFAFAQLNFNLRRTTPYEALCCFLSKGFVTSEDLRQLNGRAEADDLVSKLELRALELHFRLLFRTHTNGFQPAQVAAAILSSIRASLGLAPWSDLLTHCTGFRQSDIQDCLAIVQLHACNHDATLDFQVSSNTFTEDYERRRISAMPPALSPFPSRAASEAASAETTSTMAADTDRSVGRGGSQYRLMNKIQKRRPQQSRDSGRPLSTRSLLKPTNPRNQKP